MLLLHENMNELVEERSNEWWRNWRAFALPSWYWTYFPRRILIWK